MMKDGDIAMKQLLWIGCLESDEEFKIKSRKGYNLASAQVSQRNLIRGIEQVSGAVFDTINGSVLPYYPIYADRIIEPVTWKHTDDAFDITVGYKNDKYINRINCKKAMLTAAHDWIENRYKGGELKILVYSMRSAPMAVACYIKKMLPSSKIYLIITDLPQFMDLGESKLKSLLKKFDWISIKRMQDEFDGFILYASMMAEFLKIPDGKWMLMEGSYDIKEDIDSIYQIKHSCKKAIMYSGKLDEKYGINLLLDAFMSIQDPDLELWLTGGGNAEKYINESSKRDSRIRFYGFLPNRMDVLKLQRNAYILVNMRLPSEPASNYCFPSKLFEYMATGIPVLTFRLGGIPEEYYKYLYVVEKENKIELQKMLKKCLAYDRKELIEKGTRAQKFINKYKTNIVQCHHIIDFIG